MTLCIKSLKNCLHSLTQNFISWNSSQIYKNWHSTIYKVKAFKQHIVNDQSTLYALTKMSQWNTLLCTNMSIWVEYKTWINWNFNEKINLKLNNSISFYYVLFTMIFILQYVILKEFKCLIKSYLGEKVHQLTFTYFT